jgi:hypothetical protein
MLSKRFCLAFLIAAGCGKTMPSGSPDAAGGDVPDGAAAPDDAPPPLDAPPLDGSPRDAGPCGDLVPPPCDGAGQYFDADGCRCYALTVEPADYQTAIDGCAAMGEGWGPAALTSLDEIERTGAGLGGPTVWLGADDLAAEGTWTWATGEPFTFAPNRPPWPSWEPNGDTAENCLEEWDNNFNDLDCAEERVAMCEWPFTP